MGRKRDFYIREYFEDAEGQSGKCKACGETVQQVFTTNLKRHLRTKHAELFQEYEKRVKVENIPSDVNDKKIKFTSELSPNEVVNACVNFITKDSQPLSFFDSDSFKTLTNQIFDGLKMPRITSHSIMQFANEKCSKLKCSIQEMLSGKLLCLKIDTATRSDRGVLCINAQLFVRDKIEIVTLSMEEIKGRHTAENIKLSIERVMRSYEIKKEQIYSVTSDNGRNLLKAVELLSDTISDNEDDNDDAELGASSEFSGESFRPILGDHIISIKCAAHTLQLAVKDFLEEYSSGIVSNARRVVKLLRTPLLRCKIKVLDLAKPQLDVPTRWSSTYNMLNRLCQLKDFCVIHLPQSNHLNVDEWELVANLLAVLELPYSLTLKLQGSQLLLGDFYKNWLEMTLQLKNNESSLSKKLLSFIENRQSSLLENETLNAALFLDPRFRRVLSKETMESAKTHLKRLVRRMENLKQNRDSATSNSQPSQDTSFSVDECSMQSSSSLLRSCIRELELANSSSDEDFCEVNDEIQKAFYEIDSYKEKRVDVDADVIKYWNSKKYTFPWLRKLAFAVHSVPATQVSVERAFSALKLILSDLRYNLSEQNVETICLLKLNSNIV